MGLTISNNGAAQKAGYYLGKAQDNFQHSIKRLSSGKRLIGPSEDPGSVAVAMKVNASISRLTGAQNNIKNAIGFLEVQDGLLETVGRVVMRMSELKGYASQDPLKSDSDVASYNNEFRDLQVQLYQISQMEFNGSSLFANYATDQQNPGEVDNTKYAVFGAENQHLSFDHTLDIYTSSEGSDGTKVSIHKSLLLSALTLKQDRSTVSIKIAGDNNASEVDNNVTAILPDDRPKSGIWAFADNSKQHPTGYELNPTTGKASARINSAYLTLAVEKVEDALDLSQVSSGVFEKAIENVVFLRAQTGGGMSRLQFSLDSVTSQETNMRTALGRIEDVDIAAESARLAKWGIMMQAAAAMAVQANFSNDVALMLLN